MSGRRYISLLIVAAAAMAVAVATVTRAQPTPDEPLPAPQAGNITGAITPADQVESLTLVSRKTGVTAEPTAFDATTGEFSFAELPGEAAYDLVIATTDGRSIEGIDLSFVDWRLLRLAADRREQLGVTAEEVHSFTEGDAEEILRYVRQLDDFMELLRPLYVAGHGRRATVLIELMRTREFHDSGGDIIWRVELWYFENRSGGWSRVANQNRLLRRSRVRADAWGQIAVEYWPALSVLINADGTSEPVAFEIPAEIDPSRGRPAGSEMQLDTAPHILGITEVTDDADAPLLELDQVGD